MTETYTGIVAELGGPELGKSGNEKPRRVVIKQDPAAQYGKTFRVWSNSYEWEALQDKLGKEVTVEYVLEQANFTLPNGETPKPSNKITDVLPAVDGGGNGSGGGEVAGSATAPADDWTTPKRGAGGSPRKDEQVAATSPSPASSPPKYGGKRDDTDWEARTLEIEAAWAIGTLLGRAGNERVDPAELVDQAIQLVLTKRRVAERLPK